MKLYRCMKSMLLRFLSLFIEALISILTLNNDDSATERPSVYRDSNNILAPPQRNRVTVFNHLVMDFCIFWVYIVFAPIIEFGRYLWYFAEWVYLCAIGLVYVVMTILTLVFILNPKLLGDFLYFKDSVKMRLKKIKGISLVPEALHNGFRHVLCYMGFGTPGKPGGGQKSKADESASEPEDHSSDKSDDSGRSPEATPAPVQQRVPCDKLQRVPRSSEDLYHPCGRFHFKEGLPEPNECNFKHLKERLKSCVKEIQSIKGDMLIDKLACNQYKQRYVTSKEDLIKMYQINWNEAKLVAPEDDSNREIIILLTLIARVVAVADVNRENARKGDLANKYTWLTSLYQKFSLCEDFRNMSLNPSDADRCNETGETEKKQSFVAPLPEAGVSCESAPLQKAEAVGYSQSGMESTEVTAPRIEYPAAPQLGENDLFSPRKRKGEPVAETSTFIKTVRKMELFGSFGHATEGSASLGSPPPTSSESSRKFWTSSSVPCGSQPNPLAEHQLFSPRKEVKRVTFSETNVTEQMDVCDATSKPNESIFRLLSPPVLDEEIQLLEKLLQTKTICSNYESNAKERCCYTNFYSEISGGGEVCVFAERCSQGDNLDSSSKYIHTVPAGENEDAYIYFYKRSELNDPSCGRLSSNIDAMPFFVVCMSSEPLRISFFDRIATANPTSENTQYALRFLYDCNEQKNGKFKLDRKVPLEQLRKDERYEPVNKQEPMGMSPGEHNASFLVLSTNAATFILIFTGPSSGVKETTCIAEVSKDLSAINVFFRNKFIEDPDSEKPMPDEVLGGVPLNATLCSKTHFFRHLIPLFSKSVTLHPSLRLQKDEARSAIHKTITGMLTGARPKDASWVP